MATAMRKRKAAGSLESAEKRIKVASVLNTSEGIPFDPDETVDGFSDGGDEVFEYDDRTADTPNTPFSPRKKFPSELKTIKCSMAGCDKSFNRQSRLETHLRSHNNERSFVCSHEGCEKSYFDKKHLDQHIKGSHTQERKYECNWEGCGKSFLTGTRLRRHIATHEGHNRFRCTGYAPCNQNFRKHSTLQRHIQADHLEMAPYQCTYIDPVIGEACDAGFDGATSLRKHEDRVHGPPRFFCPDCTLPGVNLDGSAIHLGFTTDVQLHNHIKKDHANCAFCDKKCSSQRELQKHVESQHLGATLEQRKNISCTYERCDKKFTKIYNRNFHIQTQHEGQRFICGIFGVSKVLEIASFGNEDGCGKEYVSKANLEDHIRTAHFNLPSLINANRKKRAPKSNGEDEVEYDEPDSEETPEKPRRSKAKQFKPSAVDELLGRTYEADPRRNIPCLVSICAHLFIRDYDLQQHMRTKHHLSTPEIEEMEQEAENEPEFQFPPGDIRNEDAYGGKGGEEDVDWTGDVTNDDAYGEEGGQEDVELGRDNMMRDLNKLPFWIGGYEGTQNTDDWGREELEMRALIGDKFGGSFTEMMAE